MLSLVTEVSIEKSLDAEINALPHHDQAQVRMILRNIRACLERHADNLLSAGLVAVPVGDLKYWFVRRTSEVGLNWGLFCITDDDMSPGDPPPGKLLSKVAQLIDVYAFGYDIANIRHAIAVDLDDAPATYEEQAFEISRIVDSQTNMVFYKTETFTSEFAARATSDAVTSLLAGLVTVQNSNELRFPDLSAPAYAASDETDGAFVPGADSPAPIDLTLSDKPL